MVRTMPWRKTLGARLGLLSVAILATAILLIVADFRMLGQLDAARVQTSALGHRRGEAYRLVALTERRTGSSTQEAVHARPKQTWLPLLPAASDAAYFVDRLDARRDCRDECSLMAASTRRSLA